jgi:hypothetical protein
MPPVTPPAAVMPPDIPPFPPVKPIVPAPMAPLPPVTVPTPADRTGTGGSDPNDHHSRFVPKPQTGPEPTPAPVAPFQPAATPTPGVDPSLRRVTVTEVSPPAPRPDSPPPIGTLPTATTPTIPAPAASVVVPVSVPPTAPLVKQMTLKQHSVKVDDTYQSLATQYYGHADYAEALRAYNRTDTFASEALKAGNLVPGEKVWIPPLTELEKVSPGPGRVPATPDRTPAAPAVVPAPMAPAAPPAPAASAYKVVAPAGETLYAIAKNVLPGADDWMKIKAKNPQFVDPMQPVPYGTILAMPEGASVPAANRP